MKEIIRENEEDIKSFIKRASEEKFSTNEDVNLIFGDGITLKTSSYSDVDDVDMLAEKLETEYNTVKSYRVEQGFDAQESFEEVIHEDDMEYDENIHDEDLEEEIIFDESSFSENTTLENDIDDNIIDLDNDDSGFYEENITENKEEDLITTMSLESLHLLTEAAVRDGNFSKIDVSTKKDLVKKLEDAKVEYQVLFEEKKRQTELTKKEIDEAVHKRGKEIKELMDSIIAEKREYSKIMDEYKLELDNLEKGYALLKEKLEKGEFSQEVVDMINKSKVLEDKNIKASNLLEFIPIEELRHIYKLKWNVEAYREYIEFFYRPSDINRLNSSNDIIKNYATSAAEEEKTLILEKFPGAKIDENGNIDYNFERDDHDLIGMRDYITTLEVLVQNFEKHPVVIENKILNMMYERKSSEEIKPLLDELMSNVKSNVITQSFGSDEERLESVNLEINEITEKLDKLRELSLEEPLNEDMINVDNNRIENLKTTSDELAKEIESCEAVINKKDTKSRIDNLNETLRKYWLFKIENIEQKKLYIANNGEKENDPEIAMFDQNIEFCRKTIENLEDLRKSLIEENDKAKLFMTVKQAEAKKAKLISRKEKVDKSIKELETSKQEKIDNGYYIDTRLVNKHKKEIRNLEEELEFLENLKISLSRHSVESLQDSILNYDNPDYSSDKDLDEEEVFEENLSNEETIEESFEENLPDEEIIEEAFDENLQEEDLEEIKDERPAKKGLLAKIKSLSFKKIAAKAIAGLLVVAGVLTGVNFMKDKEINEVKEDIKETGIELENTIDKATETGLEKMESVAKVEKENIEEEKQKEEEKDMIDTSRIASDMYKAADGEFIDENKVNKERFDEKLIEDIVEKEANGETVYMIVGEDGVPIGYTDVVNENVETGKTK